MTRVLQISPTTRHEGHSKLVLRVDDEGIIERGDWVSITPVRGVEKLAVGKNMGQVPRIASRVCGICPVTLTLVGNEAMEASIGCEIPDDAHILRVILLHANRLHNLALHNLLVMPDFYLPGTDRKINPYAHEEPIRTVALRLQRLREIAQTVVQIAGGEAIHPSNPRVGGMHRNVSRQAKQKMADLAKEAVRLGMDQMEFMIAVLRDYRRRDHVMVGNTEVILPEKLGYHSQGYLATDPVYGTSSLSEHPSWDPDRFTEARPWDWHMGEMVVDLEDTRYPVGGTTPVGTIVNPQMEACSSVPLYDGQPVEVGPRARMARFRGFNEKGTIGLQIARQLEYTEVIHQMMNHIDMLNPQGKVMADHIPPGDGSTGWALNEASRGVNVHFAKVRDGKVLWYSMIVPTTWNIPTAALALVGAPWQLAEVVIRGYDPCISCATHMVVVDGDRKVIARKLLV
jgi:coenzyme F420 hydrogenase subunit alpha